MQRARALHGAGVARARLGDLRGAARCLEEAIDASQSAGVAHVKAMLSLASVRKTDGDAAGAMEALKQAEKHAPEVRERYIEPLEKQMAKDKKGKRR
jgi:YidC/Oxa1 family membrane protein insertase